MKKTSFTEEDLIKMYKMYKNKEEINYITEKLNTYPSFVKRQLSVLKDFIENDKEIPKTLNPKTLRAVEYFRNNQEKNHVNEQPKQQEIVKDDIAELSEKFEEAFNVFQKSIADLVIGMADKRAENIVKAKEKELAEQKEKYEQELLKLQTIIAFAKDSSIIGMIQKKWHSNGGGQV